MSETTSSRLLSLLSLMQGRRDWQGRELADRLEVSERTIRRDVERLRQLGYPVESVTGPAGRYRLRAGTAMPPLLLDDEEAIAIAVGLGTAARASVTGIGEASLRALVKLEQVLPGHLRERVRALSGATMTMPEAGPTVDPGTLTTLASACRDHEPVRFAYRSREGDETERRVEPHALVNLGRRWYLVAWDPDRDDWRTFRVDRLEQPRASAGRFEPRAVPGEDAAAYVAANLSSAPQRHEAVVILRCPADQVRERPYLWGTVEPVGEGICEYRTGDDDLDWLALRIAMLGVEFEVRKPPELIDHLASLAERVERSLG